MYNDFDLVYQPKVKNEQIIAVEALIRPNYSRVDTYITNVVDTLDFDIKVTNQVTHTFNQFGRIFPVSINIHPSSLQSPVFIEHCVETLANRMVTLELVESQELDVTDTTRRHINILHNNNIKVSIDDFGKNFSRSNLATQLAVEEVKFDRSVVDGIEKNYLKFRHLAFLYAQVRKLGVKNVIFEGVETQLQLDLIHMFCEDPIVQGYFYYRPMSLEEVFMTDNLHLCREYNNSMTFSQEMDLDYHVYQHLIQHPECDAESLQQVIEQYDTTGSLADEDARTTIDNFKAAYFNAHACD